MQVTPLRSSDLTPTLIAQDIIEKAPELKGLYCVGIGHNHEISLWTVGDISQMSIAILTMQDAAIKFLNGAMNGDGKKGA